MFTLPGVRQLHSWTHASLNLLLNHLATIPVADYTKQVPGFGFPTVQAQVLHILNCEGFWIHTLQSARFQSSPFQDEAPAKWPTVSDARRLKTEVSATTLQYLSRLSEQDLNTPTDLHFPDGDVAIQTPALILHHVLTHAFHHKGQIVAMCRILGHPAPDTDLNQLH